MIMQVGGELVSKMDNEKNIDYVEDDDDKEEVSYKLIKYQHRNRHRNFLRQLCP